MDEISGGGLLSASWLGSDTGFETPRSTKEKSYRFSPLGTPTVWYLRQAAGLPNKTFLRPLIKDPEGGSGRNRRAEA